MPKDRSPLTPRGFVQVVDRHRRDVTTGDLTSEEFVRAICALTGGDYNIALRLHTPATTELPAGRIQPLDGEQP